jgi:hypothetical protein
MNLFDKTHNTRITDLFSHAPRAQSVPLHRRLFPTGQSAGEVARAAVLEVLG